MVEYKRCSLCCGMGMISRSDGLRAPCPACAPQVVPIVPQLDPDKIDTYLDQCSISANIATVEPVVKLSRSEQMKRSWVERRAKAAGVKAE